MTGFQAPRKIYRLTFADPDLAGLEVRARSVSTGQFLEISSLAELAGEHGTSTDANEVRKLFTAFAGAVVSWNLEDRGHPIAPDVEGLYSQDFDFVLNLIMAWLGAIASVPDPLGRASSGGERFPEESLPMESLSPSPSS